MIDRQNGTIDYISYLGLATLALCFGSTFYFTSLALTGFSVAGTGAARICVAAVFIVPVSIMLGHGLPNKFKSWLWATVFGLMAWVVPFLLLVWAQTRIPTNVIGAFFASVPLLILFLSWAILKTPVTWRKKLGMAIGSVGLILLAGPGTFSQIGANSQYLPQIATLIACFCFAAGAIMIRLMPSASPLQATAGASLASAVLVLPILYFEFPEQAPGMPAILGVLSVGIISTALGQFVRFFLIRRRGPIFVVPNGYLAAICAAILGAVLLGETLTPAVLLAFGIIFTGLIIASDGSGRMKQS